MRPVYERDEDVSRQAFVASELEHAWGVILYPLPKFCVVDFLACHSSSLSFRLIEIKCRNCASSRYESLILSRAKIDAAMQAVEMLSTKLILAIGWNDGIFHRSVAPSDLWALRRSTGGREDRGDPKDIETVYHFPVASFERLNDAA